jgi:hypothetical protein
VALNWTMTNASENTMPVRAIIPDAMEEQIAMADGALMVETRLGKNRCSTRRKPMPTISVATT